jgi:hypothetical protein
VFPAKLAVTGAEPAVWVTEAMEQLAEPEESVMALQV